MVRLIISVLISLNSSIVFSQVSSDSIVGTALEDYGVISGSWHLNNHCKILDATLANEYERYVGAITIALRTELKNPEILLKIQANSKSIINKEPYLNCQKETKKIMAQSVLLAKNWFSNIQKLNGNGSKFGIKNEEAKKYSALVAAYHVEAKCKFGTEEDLSNIKLMLDAIRKVLFNRGVEIDRLNKLGFAVKRKLKNGAFTECDSKSEAFTTSVRKSSWTWVTKLVAEKSNKVNKASNPTP
jgi:hypothetical protein